ncbi:MAG: site-2 protease family protein [Candidatus Uhrbacteria bacterium]|nr:site-2 protease family protein [Candidatus Uhrbacteria bacterium]
MFLTLLYNSPAIAIVWIVVIFMSITVHEFAHALAGHLKGDPTAANAGRLTLNPIAHIDPMGLIPLILLGFGWAKPVPFNPYNLKNPKVDAVYIALAGPLANLILASLAAIALRILSMTDLLTSSTLLPVFLVLLVIINLFLLFFNIIPVHPLDGSKLVDALLVKPKHQKFRNAIATYGPQVLIVLVLISIISPAFNVFFFVSWPAYMLCDLLVGENCLLLFSLIFG